MAHKKGVGSSRNGRESHSKRLGVKIFGGSHAIAGNILVRQRGTKHYPGVNVGMGKDHTLYALVDGTVVYRKKAGNKSYVSVEPMAEGTTGVVTAEKPVKVASKAETPVDVAVQEAPAAEKEADTAEAAAEESKEKPVAEKKEAEGVKEAKGAAKQAEKSKAVEKKAPVKKAAAKKPAASKKEKESPEKSSPGEEKETKE